MTLNLQEKVLYYDLMNVNLSETHFMSLGLVIDRPNGNILKIDSKSRVLLAYHGSRKLNEEEIVQAYGKSKETEFTGSSSGRFWCLATYFESSICSLYRDLIDLHDKNKSSPENGNFI